MSPAQIRHSARRNSTWVFALAAVVFAGLYFIGPRASHADSKKQTVEMRHISVAGIGSTAKAWYDGAPPGGVLLQSALDTMAEQGFRIVRTSDAVSVTNLGGSWFILLEKVTTE